MIRLVYRYVLPLVILLVAALLGYNYFFGDQAEKANARRIMSQVKGLGSSVVSLLGSEKDKYEKGKYDGAMEKIGDSVSKLKQQASNLSDGGEKWLSKVDDIEKRRAELQGELDAMDESAAAAGGDGPDASGLRAKIEALAGQAEQLGEKIGEE